MGNCSSSELGNPSTPSSPHPRDPSLLISGDPLCPPSSTARMEPYLPASGIPGHPSPPVDSSLLISGDPVLSPSHIAMEPSLPTAGDSVRPSPPVVPSLPTSEDPVHPSSSMERFLSKSGDPGPSSPRVDALKSIRGVFLKIDPVELIHPLVSFIENQPKKMNTPSEAGSSSSEGSLPNVTEAIQHTIDTISKEAEKVSESDAVKEMGRIILKVLEGTGQLHQVFLGLSVAAFAADRYRSAVSPADECKDLLLKILPLAKLYGEKMSDEKEKLCDEEELCDGVVTIVESAVIACDYINMGIDSRLWSATTADAQFNKQLRDVKNFLALCSVSLSSLKKYWDKDVFLSHSGKQKNFVRQLFQDFTDREHVSCFFDEDPNSLPHGYKFPPIIFKAAQACKTAVVLLSEDFIRSKWPMLELAAFIRAKNTGKNAKLLLIPIFFKISPEKIFDIIENEPEWKKLEERNAKKGEWKDALEEVRSMNGHQLAEDGNEVECRNKVVKEISRFLRGINPPKLLEFVPVGIEPQMLEVKQLLDMEGAESALAVIVYGFGGIGKSTAASSLDWVSTDFKFCWVSTQDRTSHILKLQKDIKPDLRNFKEGRDQIKKALSQKRSLLFIDNVADKDYVKDLLPTDLPSNEQHTKLRIIITSREKNVKKSNEQHTKLRIIITSREKNVKAELKIMWKEYEVKCLSDEASKSLLSKTILESSDVKDEDEKVMICEVSAACRGVPLLLSVFGKHLSMERHDNSYRESCNEVLKYLREGNLDNYRDEDLGTRIMFVYDKIKDEDVKEAFLDICNYVHGWQWNLVVDIVDFYVLEELSRRSLLSKSSSGEVIVHDILRSMGIKKANLTRVSNYKELSDALEDNLNEVKGISLRDDDSNLITIESTKLEAMHKSLRVLMMGNWVTLEGPPCKKEFRNLRYLRLGDVTDFLFKDPSKLYNLRVFVNGSKPGMSLSSLPSNLICISHKVRGKECNKFVKLPFQNLSSLKSFVIKQNQLVELVELPEELHLPPSLLDLNLSSCKNLPKDIGHLTNLESLILDGSPLERLPSGFCRLKKLKHLSMNFCSELAILPDKLGMLSSLKTLSMDSCSKLAILPDELGMLTSLETLRMTGCRNLSALPKTLGGLRSLQTIKFSECIKLQELPESFAELHIELLNLHWLPKLNELPNSFGIMTLLK